MTVREATEAEREGVGAPPGGLVLVCDGNDGIDGAIAGDVVDGVAYVWLASGERAVRAALLRELAGWFRESGATAVHVIVAPEDAPDWEALGFTETRRELGAPLELLERQVAERPGGRSFGSIHVQSDDLARVERAVDEYVRRLPGRSGGHRVMPPRNGWIAVYDELCDRDPRMLRRLARELSDRLGAVVLAIGVEEGAVVRFVLLERGRLMDEYLSVPEFYGPLPPGEVVALRANPTVVARLTGADPAAVRAAAVNGTSPAELPPPAETIAALGRALGVEGAEQGYRQAFRAE